jgi:hypothetical protein
MIIEGEWERVDPSKPKSKSDTASKPMPAEPVKPESAKAEEAQFTAAVEAYAEQAEKADAARTVAAERQDDAFKEKLAELKEHLRERDTKG